MNNIHRAFENGKAFIAFITCGDPDLETTAAVVRTAAQNGADLIELGIPFSDPTAEGPVIQGANFRALRGGVTTDRIFDLVRELRRDVTIPMVFMTYSNVVFSYGSERFIRTCREIEIDGLILPDVPFEEKGEFLVYCHAYDVNLISLIAQLPRTASRKSPRRRRASSISFPASESPGPAARSPLISKASCPSSGNIQRSPVLSASESQRLSRRGRWRMCRMGPSWARPLSRSWKNTAGMLPKRWETTSRP